MGRYKYGRKNIVIWVCSSVGNSSDQKDGGCDVPLRYVRANVRGSAYWAVVLWPKLGTTEFNDSDMIQPSPSSDLLHVIHLYLEISNSTGPRCAFSEAQLYGVTQKGASLFLQRKCRLGASPATLFKIPIFFGVILFRCAAGSTGPYSSPFHFGMSALACDGLAPERRTRQKR